jgi:putative flippase GtrA
MGVPYLVAAGAGYVSGVFLGYGLNRWWTFGVRDSHAMLAYGGLYTATLLVSLVLLRVLVESVGLAPTFANLLVIVVTTILNFVGSKYVVFKV